MKFCSVIVIVAILSCFVSTGCASRILAILPLPDYSHWVFYKPLLRTLTENGHVLTVLAHYTLDPPLPRYRGIKLDDFPEDQDFRNVSYDFIKSGKGNISKLPFQRSGVDLCSYLYDTDQFQALVSTDEQFDVLITEAYGTDCCLPMAHRFGIPAVVVSPSPALPWTCEALDIPDNPSYVPNFLLPNAHQFGLKKRVLNAFLQIFTKLRYVSVSRSSSDDIVKRLIPNSPPLEVLAQNVSLLIANSHFSLGGARPGIPAFFEAAGMHIEDSAPLPKDVAKVLDNSTEGVVYFSMGARMNPESLPFQKLQSIIDVLGALPHRILWKGDGSALPQPLPSNFATFQWLPQRDALCHRNILAFVTQGGLLGTQEAVYCGVPMVVLPVLVEEERNAENYVGLGIAVRVGFNDLENTFEDALRTVLDNPSYRQKSQELAVQFQDRPQKPAEVAAYWVEYVLRHAGAPHLRTAARSLKWYQFYMLDIVVFLLGCLIVTVLFVRMVYNIIVRENTTVVTRKDD